MESWFITYTEKLPGTGKALILVRSDGNSDVILNQDPYGLPFEGRSEIGHFQHQLKGRDAAALRQFVEPALSEASSEPTELEPGTLTVAFGLGFDEVLGDLVSFSLDDKLPLNTNRFREELLKSADEIVQHPNKTIKAQAQWLKSELTTGDNTLWLELRLINSGIVPITIANPAAAPSDDAVGLTLMIHRDLPPEKLTSRDAGSLQILLREVKQIASEKVEGEVEEEAAALITLHPDQELLLNIMTRRHVYMTPGTYVGSISLNLTPGDIPEEETIIGNLSTQTGSFVVRRS